MKLTVGQLQEIMTFLSEGLDNSIGCTEEEWVDILDNLEEDYGEDALITKELMKNYWKEN